MRTKVEKQLAAIDNTTQLKSIAGKASNDAYLVDQPATDVRLHDNALITSRPPWGLSVGGKESRTTSACTP